MMSKKEEQPHEQRLGTLKNGNPPCDLSKLPRCTAKSKQTGKPCKQPAMKGKRVCYYHGGKSPGAPKSNMHALKHGQHTAEAIKERKFIRDLIKGAKETLRKL